MLGYPIRRLEDLDRFGRFIPKSGDMRYCMRILGFEFVQVKWGSQTEKREMKLPSNVIETGKITIIHKSESSANLR